MVGILVWVTLGGGMTIFKRNDDEVAECAN